MEYFQMIMALVGVLALVFLMFWAMKKLNGKAFAYSSRHIKVLERVSLAQDKMLVLVSVCGKCYALSVTSGHTDIICELSQTEEELTAKPEGENPSFKEALRISLEKMKKK